MWSFEVKPLETNCYLRFSDGTSRQESFRNLLASFREFCFNRGAWLPIERFSLYIDDVSGFTDEHVMMVAELLHCIKDEIETLHVCYIQDHIGFNGGPQVSKFAWYKFGETLRQCRRLFLLLLEISGDVQITRLINQLEPCLAAFYGHPKLKCLTVVYEQGALEEIWLARSTGRAIQCLLLLVGVRTFHKHAFPIPVELIRKLGSFLVNG